MADSGTGNLYKWTAEQTRLLIRYRTEKEEQFTKKKYAAKQLWESLIKQLGLEGKVTTQQVSKKWENLKKKYKDLKTPKTGSGTESGEVTAATWQYFADMHEVIGARPSIAPPVVVASFQPELDKETPGTCAEPTDPAAAAPASSLPNPAAPTTPSPVKKKPKSNNPLLEFLKKESENEQQRHEASEAKTERFLALFQRMVDRMPEQ